MKQEVEVEPLTRTTKEGQTYRRRPVVEEQLRELLPLHPDELNQRLEKSDYNEPGYVKSECLAHLLRRHRSLGQDDAVSDLCRVLIARLTPTINHYTQFVSPARKQECLDEIITGIIVPVIDLETDNGDYAQVNFGQWVKYHILDAVDRYFSIGEKEQRTDSLTRPEDDAEEEVGASGEEFRVADLRPEEYSAVIASALDGLSEDHRMAYIMRHMWEWEIENQDPNVPTISRHFGKTPRTINNWLNNVDKKLAEWKTEGARNNETEN